MPAAALTINSAKATLRGRFVLFTPTILDFAIGKDGFMKRIVAILLLLSLLTLLFSCYKDNGANTENNGDVPAVTPPAGDGEDPTPDDPTGDVNPPATETIPDLWADYTDDPNDTYTDGGTVTNYPFGADIKTEPIAPDTSVELSLSTLYFSTNYVLTYDIRIENGVLFVDNGQNGDYVEIGALAYTEDVTFHGNDYFYHGMGNLVIASSPQLQQYAVFYLWDALYRVHRASTAYTAIIPGQSGDSLAYWRIYVFDGVYYVLYLSDSGDGVNHVAYFGTSAPMESYADPVPFDEDVKTERFSPDHPYTAVTYGYKNSSSTEIIAYNIKIADGNLYVKPADSNGDYYKWGSLTLKEASPFVFDKNVIKGVGFGNSDEERLASKEQFSVIRRSSTVYIVTRDDGVTGQPFAYDYLAIYLLDGDCYMFGVFYDDYWEEISYDRLFIGNAT